MRIPRVLLRHAARASHHEFPYGMTVMNQLLACTNGAQTQVFPGTSSPIWLPIFNINYPQTRMLGALDPQAVAR